MIDHATQDRIKAMSVPQVLALERRCADLETRLAERNALNAEMEAVLSQAEMERDEAQKELEQAERRGMLRAAEIISTRADSYGGNDGGWLNDTEKAVICELESAARAIREAGDD